MSSTCVYTLLVSYHSKRSQFHPRKVRLRRKDYTLLSLHPKTAADPLNIFKMLSLTTPSPDLSNPSLTRLDEGVGWTHRHIEFDSPTEPPLVNFIRQAVGFRAKGILREENDKFLCDVEVTFTDYFGRTELFTFCRTVSSGFDKLNSLPEYQQFQLHAWFGGIALSVDGSPLHEYLIHGTPSEEVQAFITEHTMSSPICYESGFDPLNVLAEDMYITDLFKTHQQNLMAVSSWLERCLPLYLGKDELTETTHLPLMEDIQTALKRVAELLEPFWFYRVGPLLLSREPMINLPIAIEANRRYEALKQAARDEQLVTFELLQIIKTDWIGLLRQVDSPNNEYLNRKSVQVQEESPQEHLRIQSLRVSTWSTLFHSTVLSAIREELYPFPTSGEISEHLSNATHLVHFSESLLRFCEKKPNAKVYTLTLGGTGYKFG